MCISATVCVIMLFGNVSVFASTSVLQENTAERFVEGEVFDESMPEDVPMPDSTAVVNEALPTGPQNTPEQPENGAAEPSKGREATSAEAIADESGAELEQAIESDGWVLMKDQWNENWHFFYGGGYRYLGWLFWENNWYYLDTSGMWTGWLWDNKDKNYYYLNEETGIMQTGWFWTGTDWRYLDSSGRMVTSPTTIDGKLHQFDHTGVWRGEGSTIGGWRWYDNRWCYQYVSGDWAYDWAKIDGTWYYFDQEGYMQTGWVFAQGPVLSIKEKDNRGDPVWFYLHPSGEVASGWLFEGGKWYYLSPYVRTPNLLAPNHGTMLTGWLLYKNAWYYLLPSGAMATGWVLIGNQWGLDPVWLCFSSSGKLMQDGKEVDLTGKYYDVFDYIPTGAKGLWWPEDGSGPCIMLLRPGELD